MNISLLVGWLFVFFHTSDNWSEQLFVCFFMLETTGNNVEIDNLHCHAYDDTFGGALEPEFLGTLK